MKGTWRWEGCGDREGEVEGERRGRQAVRGGGVLVQFA